MRIQEAQKHTDPAHFLVIHSCQSVWSEIQWRTVKLTDPQLNLMIIRIRHQNDANPPSLYTVVLYSLSLIWSWRLAPPRALKRSILTLVSLLSVCSSWACCSWAALSATASSTGSPCAPVFLRTSFISWAAIHKSYFHHPEIEFTRVIFISWDGIHKSHFHLLRGNSRRSFWRKAFWHRSDSQV